MSYQAVRYDGYIAMNSAGTIGCEWLLPTRNSFPQPTTFILTVVPESEWPADKDWSLNSYLTSEPQKTLYSASSNIIKSALICESIFSKKILWVQSKWILEMPAT